MHTFIIQPAGIFRQIHPASLYNLLIHFHQINIFNRTVTCQLMDNAAVSCSDHKYILNSGMNRHWHVHNHFIINKLIPFRQHDISIQ